MSGKAPKQKGNRLEREIVQHLQQAGLEAKRVPLSGSARGFKGDVIVTLSTKHYRLECKSRKDFRTLYGWLEGNDALILKGDRQEPLVVMRLADLLALHNGP